MVAIQLDTEVAMTKFVERFRMNKDKEQVDNSTLYAGSPMYYYCKFCGEHTQTLPECHFSAPKTICDPCEVLNAHGLIPDAKKRVEEEVQ